MAKRITALLLVILLMAGILPSSVLTVEGYGDEDGVIALASSGGLLIITADRTRQIRWIGHSDAKLTFSYVDATGTSRGGWITAITCYKIDNVYQLEEVLLSPAPRPKKIGAPAGIRKCPYAVGSLLAYRMISSPNLIDTPFWGKYVLLRVIKINKTPVTLLAPDACYSESMLVGLYDWVGETIPNPNIVDHLRFTPIVLSDSSNPSVDFALIQDHLSTAISDDVIKEARNIMTRSGIETCCCLDWICVKGIDSNEVFTLLGCDDNFANHTLPFFDTAITAYSFAHSVPFDVMLKNRFEHKE